MASCQRINEFCFICGEYSFPKQRSCITAPIRVAFEKYFGFTLNDTLPWTPSICCHYCCCRLQNWIGGRATNSKLFAVPMLWWKPQEDHKNCYFCQFPNISGIKMKNKGLIVYPNECSVQFPVPHCEMLPRPSPPVKQVSEELYDDDNGDRDAIDAVTSDPDFVCPEGEKDPQVFNQSALNDLFRDLELSGEKCEVLASRLKERNLCDQTVKITAPRQRYQDLLQFFSNHGDFVVCDDVEGLLNAMEIEYNAGDWRLFLDSSKKSFKAVLLHNGNKLPSIPVGYSTKLKETYSDVKRFLEGMLYWDHRWKLCCDLKMVAILLGLQLGYTKFCCIYCLWDSRARSKHYKKRRWPKRNAFRVGKHNVKYPPLVRACDIIPPPLHIKLGVFSTFIKAMNQEDQAFLYLFEKFTGVSEAKLKQGILVGPQIRSLLKDDHFDSLLSGVTKTTWHFFRRVSNEFLGNYRAPDYKKLIRGLIHGLRDMEANMSPKVHYLDSHLDLFPDNCGAFSDEHGEFFHQQLAIYENRNPGRLGPTMLAQFCWNQLRDEPNKNHKRKVRHHKFF